MDGQEGDAQPSADEHHRDVRHAGGFRQHLRVARPWIAGGGERLFVEGRGDQAVHEAWPRLARRRRWLGLE
jgi:hypothetical protein